MPEQGRFARARRSNKGYQLARGDTQIHLFQRSHGFEGLGDVAHLDSQCVCQNFALTPHVPFDGQIYRAVLSGSTLVEECVGGTESEESRDSDVSLSDRLHPYISWQGKGTPDPRTTAANRVDQALFEIIECEGPVLVARVYSLYAKACGLRVGGQVKSSLNRALSRLVRAKRVILENEHDKPGQVNSIVRVAGCERIRLRELGPRTLAEIPPSEISAHMRLLKDAEPDSEKEELFRTLLSRYGLARLTSSTRSILNQVARSVYI